MTEENQTVESPLPEGIHSVKIAGKVYSVESLNEKGAGLINDLQRVDKLLADQQLAVSVTTVARGKLLEELEKEAVNFTEVEDPDGEETSDGKENKDK